MKILIYLEKTETDHVAGYIDIQDLPTKEKTQLLELAKISEEQLKPMKELMENCTHDKSGSTLWEYMEPKIKRESFKLCNPEIIDAREIPWYKKVLKFIIDWVL